MSGAAAPGIGSQIEDRVEERLARWREARFARRLWQHDYRLWASEPVPELADRLGWLDLPETMAGSAGVLRSFAEEALREGVREMVLLGMGGSSLAPDVFQRVFGSQQGRPSLTLADSTHPDAVRGLLEAIDPERTLWLVSSKSGTTVETLSLFYVFWERAAASLAEPGRRFVAITDPGTPLERLAAERRFRRCFTAAPEVGGRYSALSHFGLVPAALLGLDPERLLARARGMADRCRSEEGNPGLRLGALLAEAGLAGHDKLTLLTSPSLASFPDWLEQLVAESTGKEGRGIVPVAGEPAGAAERYGKDRLFVATLLEGDEEAELESLLSELEEAGHPLLRFRIGEPYDLAAEIFRWQVAVAAAGAALAVQPFDQPDVQLAKLLASEAIAGRRSSGAAAPPEVDAGDEGLGPALRGWLEAARPGDYLALQAYLPPEGGSGAKLRRIQARLRDRTGLAATAGWGPRFLHSTGQLHKGGPNRGLFLQIVDRPGADLAVPECDYTFGSLIAAQAEGDAAALLQRGRRILRVRLGADRSAGLRNLRRALG